MQRLSEVTKIIRANRASSSSHANIDALYGAAAAALTAHARGQHYNEVLRAFAGTGTTTEIMFRATVSPANTTTSTSAAELVGMTVGSLAVLAGASAAGRLFASNPSQQYVFDGFGSIFAPSITASANDATFIEEGKPIPVRQLSLTAGVPLTAKKLAMIAAFTRETFEHSLPTIQNTVETTLSESIALSLDAKVFDTNAADATRPAGLLNGIGAGTESSSTIPSEAMLEDVANLTGTVAAVAAGSPIVIVASPKQYAALRTRLPAVPFDVFPSSALADKTVLAVASNAITSASSGLPRFEIAKNATLHFEDTTPLDITTASVATTVKSLYQSDLIGLRVIFQASWGLRSSSGIAVLSNVKW